MLQAGSPPQCMGGGGILEAVFQQQTQKSPCVTFLREGLSELGIYQVRRGTKVFLWEKERV